MIENTATRLQQIMRQRGLKQADIIRLAQPYCERYKIKLGKSDLSQFVSGKVEPGQWKITILGLALNVSEAWLMGLDVPMEREAPTITSERKDVLDEVDIAFYGEYKELDEDQKETVRDMVRVMRARRAKQEK